MIELNEQQQQALAVQQETPLKVVNPATRETFVLLRTEDFERMRTILDEDENLRFAREMAPFMWETMKDDWKNMEEFDQPQNPKLK